MGETDWDRQWLREAESFNEIRIVIHYTDRHGNPNLTKQVAIPKEIQKDKAVDLITRIADVAGLEIKWIAKIVKIEEKEVTELDLGEDIG